MTDEIDKISGLLDFYSGRAVAHASFFVASMFGLITFSAMVIGKFADSLPLYCLSIFLFFAFAYSGYYTIVRFGYYANAAQNIARYGLNMVETLRNVKPQTDKLDEGQLEQDKPDKLLNLWEIVDAYYKEQAQFLLPQRILNWIYSIEKKNPKYPIGKMTVWFLYWLLTSLIGVLVFYESGIAIIFLQFGLAIIFGIVPILVPINKPTSIKLKSSEKSSHAKNITEDYFV